MAISSDILPPPAGLDLDEIATDVGLLNAIEREAAVFRDAEKKSRRLTHDEIRLISFLAGEVHRRIRTLSSAEKTELEQILVKAHERDTERAVREIVSDVDKFDGDTRRLDITIIFSRVNELEIRLQKLRQSLDRESEKYATFMDKLGDAMEELKNIKKRGYKGYEELD